MNHIEFEELKGFMPRHEGNALLRWAKKFSKIGPILEIGTYCGKSALYVARCVRKSSTGFFNRPSFGFRGTPA